MLAAQPISLARGKMATLMQILSMLQSRRTSAVGMTTLSSVEFFAPALQFRRLGTNKLAPSSCEILSAAESCTRLILPAGGRVPAAAEAWMRIDLADLHTPSSVVEQHARRLQPSQKHDEAFRSMRRLACAKLAGDAWYRRFDVQ